jgi:hypothetical protein
MGQLGASNFNFNFNVGTALSTGSGGARVRANTLDFSKLVKPANDALIPTKFQSMRFPLNWDPELRASIYVNEFVATYPQWEERLRDPAVIGRCPTDLPAEDLRREILDMLNGAVERERRFMEIIQQHDAEGAIDYWLGMLMITPGRSPATYLLIRAARRIGELVVMCLKGHFRCPRPSQFSPAIVPMIDPPVTPSFPAGHALQSQMISLCLDAAWPDRADRRFVFELARRVADNRMIAGLHFPRDNEAGIRVADECFAMLRAPGKCPEFNALIAAAGAEFAGPNESE